MTNPFDEYREPEVSASYPAVTDESGLETESESDVFVVLTQAFDADGNNLIADDGPNFDGFPGVTLRLGLPDGREGLVTLSPIHGDTRKEGLTDVEPGTVCTLLSSVDGSRLEPDGRCTCGQGTYHRIYLSPRLSHGEVALVCDVWGCHRSRIMDDADLLSWVDY